MYHKKNPFYFAICENINNDVLIALPEKCDNVTRLQLLYVL